jgi:transmembrane sensor
MIPSEEINVLLNKLWSGDELDVKALHRLETWRALPGALEAETIMYKTWEAAEGYSTAFEPDMDVAWEQFSSRMLAGDNNRFEKTPAPRQRRIRLWIAAAAGLIGIIFFTWLNRPLQPEFSIRTITATEATPLEVVLPDGSWVALQYGSSLTWPEPFEKAVPRSVTLLGQAYFKVNRDPQKPFRVEGDFAYAEVLGTAFNAVVTQGGGFEITVEEGKVSLVGGRESVILGVGQRGILRADGSISTASDASGNALSWFHGELKFRNAPISEVLESLSRHFGVRIEANAERLKGCSFTGRFMDLTFSEVIATLELTFGSKVIMTSEGQYVLEGGSCAW